MKLSREFIRYVACGVTANAIDIGGYLLLLYLGVWYLGASITSGILGFISAFVLQKYVVFRKKERAPEHFLRYVLQWLFNIAATSLVLFICVEWIGIPEEIAKFISNGSQVLWNFFLLKFLVYV